MQTEYWAAVLKPGRSYRECNLKATLHLKQATMSFRDDPAQSHLLTQEVHMVVQQGALIRTTTPEVLLCTLGTLQTGETVQHIPRVPLDIKIERECDVIFTATAPVHLIGYFEIDEGERSRHACAQIHRQRCGFQGTPPP